MKFHVKHLALILSLLFSAPAAAAQWYYWFVIEAVSVIDGQIVAVELQRTPITSSTVPANNWNACVSLTSGFSAVGGAGPTVFAYCDAAFQ